MGKVYVVHCIDTEGPLDESLEATFQRIRRLTGAELEPTRENLRRVQEGEADLGGREELAKYVFCERFLHYNRTWGDIDRMLDEMTGRDYRMRYRDSAGEGWKYSWFIVDFADFQINPRNRDIGYHNIYDHYCAYYNRHCMEGDDFQWHAHPMSVYREAHRCGTSYVNSPHIFQSLARRLIDRGAFPNCFRPGFHAERPDSHWLLEQYIPYDYGNQSVKPTDSDCAQEDLSGGRFGDWRRAPSTWEPYHPSHDDYQVKGDCRRTIFRCLNVGTRTRCLTQEEVDRAFQRAGEEEDTILAFADHDFRHMAADVDEVYRMIQIAHGKYPSVSWHNTTAQDAARAIAGRCCDPMEVECRLDNDGDRGKLLIRLSTDSFGPQPFFAIKMHGGRYCIDNLDVQVPRRAWSYTFDEDSVHMDDVECIGVATNSMHGTGALRVIGSDGRTIFSSKW